MNWSKVKTIAIIAFLIINIYLVFRLYSQIPMTSIIPDTQIKKAIAILNKNGIAIKCKIPNEIYSVSKLNVMVESSFQDIIKKLFGNRIDKYKNEYQSSLYYIKIENGVLHLTSTYDINPFELLEINQNNYYKDPILNQYIQIYKGIFLFDGKMIVSKKDNGVQITFSKIKPLTFELDKKRTISSTEAIFNLLNQSKNIKTIQDIKFGYYQKDLNIIKGEALPVWRIIADNQVFYINAFSGWLE
ncbi:hypothetical protein ACAG39_07815 [Caldicellulosiruptoraceae bacterium PP1]